MKYAITGGTGFVGRALARRLEADGQEVVVISRRTGVSVADVDALAAAFAACDGVAHCAGINRELRGQRYADVHVEGTRNVVEAARRAGVKKVVLMSFLRARPGCGSGYHESKFAAEEIVRTSGLDYTVLKPGVVYGPGDHMLDHLSHALHTFPVFGLVGLRRQRLRPTAVADLARVLVAALTDARLSRKTIAVTGPDELTLEQAVRRVGEAVDRRPLYVRMPGAFHYALACVLERVMKVPMVALAQVRILSESLVEPVGAPDELPADLAPRTAFTQDSIRAGLPAPGRFGLADLELTPCPR
jgi:NADH dehydrogenase